MIFEVIKDLAKTKGVSIYRLEIDNGLSNGSISKWNNFMPNAESLSKVAKCLGTTSEEILKMSKKAEEV